MKKGTVINSHLSDLIANLGHTDEFTIGDAGLPIPDDVWRIDLALAKGIPTFMDTLTTVLSECHIEKAIITEEMLAYSPHIRDAIKEAIGETPIEVISHLAFKERTQSSKAVIRTGEFTPYANVILVSGPWGFDL
ncbi:MAG: D-ribose pyranase [Chloroflexota bacterium]